MRRILALAMLAGALAGCAGQQLQPPGMLTITAIQATEGQLAAVTDIPDFYRVGLFLAQEQCGTYFDSAVMQALRSAKTSGEAALLSGLATGLMGLSGVGGPAVGAVGLAATFGQQMLSNSEDNSLAGSDPAATATLVSAAQSALIQAEQNPATAADAYADIFAVYRACSPAGIRGLEEAAIRAAPTHLVISSGTSGVVPASAFAPRRATSSAALPMVSVH